jgi:hypothetical protein
MYNYFNNKKGFKTSFCQLVHWTRINLTKFEPNCFKHFFIEQLLFLSLDLNQGPPGTRQKIQLLNFQNFFHERGSQLFPIRKTRSYEVRCCCLNPRTVIRFVSTIVLNLALALAEVWMGHLNVRIWASISVPCHAGAKFSSSSLQSWAP